MGVLEATFCCTIELKIAPNIFLDDTLDEFEFGSWGGHKLGHEVKLKKYLVDPLKTTFTAQST